MGHRDRNQQQRKIFTLVWFDFLKSMKAWDVKYPKEDIIR